MSFPIVFTNLSFSWSDGTAVLDDVSTAFNTGHTGLVGVNGSGKTTLLRLVAGQLTPSSGSVTVHGDVAYLPQNITLSHGSTVADLLGIGEKMRALRSIESGSTDPKHFDAIGSDWDIEDRANRILWVIGSGGGLTALDLDRTVANLSGGEATVVAVAGCRLRRRPITLMDEPTNNLDAVLRSQVLDMISTWPGTVVVVSHDTGLLDLMDTTVELRRYGLTTFSGGYSAWRKAVDAERAATERALTSAEQAVKVAQRQRGAVMAHRGKSLVQGGKKAISQGIDKETRHFMRNRAEASSARERGLADDRLDQARSALLLASEHLREDDHITVDLPKTSVPSGRRILEFEWEGNGHLIMRGPERVRLSGRNGAGKTTLIEQLLGHRTPGTVRTHVFTTRVGYLPQRIGDEHRVLTDGLDNGLDDTLSAVDNVSRFCPSASTGDIRSRLARLLIRGDAAFLPVSSLSGGERFRVALACLLFAEPPAQLLILDEPTNNLDQPSLDHLVEALSGYHGAMLVVSHNEDFINRIGLDMDLELRNGTIIPR